MVTSPYHVRAQIRGRSDEPVLHSWGYCYCPCRYCCCTCQACVTVLAVAGGAPQVHPSESLEAPMLRDTRPSPGPQVVYQHSPGPQVVYHTSGLPVTSPAPGEHWQRGSQGLKGSATRHAPRPPHVSPAPEICRFCCIAGEGVWWGVGPSDSAVPEALPRVPLGLQKGAPQRGRQPGSFQAVSRHAAGPAAAPQQRPRQAGARNAPAIGCTADAEGLPRGVPPRGHPRRSCLQS